MAVVLMKHLLEAGVHFGHQTRRWNPKMKRYIFSERNGIYILDLQKTLALIEVAYEFLREVASKGGIILFVGTKKQAQEAVKEEAIRCGMPYVNNRWLGGTLTNFKTINKRIERLKELIELFASEDGLARFSKKEVARFQAEYVRLERNLGSLREMTRVPDVLYVVDPRKEQIAVLEARRLGIPIVAIVDTNCDPDEVDYVIPGNDDAIRAIALITRAIGEAVIKGKESQAIVEEGEAGATEEKEAEISPEEAPVGEEEAPAEVVEEQS